MAKQTFTTGQVLTAAQMTSLQQTAMGGGSTTAKTASYTLVAADAGTVVQMNSASATTITVNTALFAAGDTVTIQNVGAGVCTITAGTATVNTSATLALKQYDAGSLYFNTTSAAIFFAVDAADGMTNPFTTTGDTVYASGGTTPTRLGIGSTGQVLTVASGVPSWATPSAGGYTSIASGSFSGAAVSVSSIPATYRDLVFIWRDYYFVNDDLMTGYVNGTTSIYTNLEIGNGAAPMTSGYIVPTQSETTDNTDNNNFLMLRFYDYANTSSHKIVNSMVIQRNTANTDYRLLNTTTAIKLTNAITSIAFGTQTGANISGGTYVLYGVS